MRLSTSTGNSDKRMPARARGLLLPVASRQFDGAQSEQTAGTRGWGVKIDSEL